LAGDFDDKEWGLPFSQDIAWKHFCQQSQGPGVDSRYHISLSSIGDIPCSGLPMALSVIGSLNWTSQKLATTMDGVLDRVSVAALGSEQNAFL
jgi:hypothetical protein